MGSVLAASWTSHMFQEIGKTTAVAAKVTKAPWSTVQGIIYIYTVYILICRTRKRRGDERRNKNSFDIFWQMLRTSMLFGYIFYLVRPCLTAQVPSQRRLLRKLSRLERGAGVRLQQRFGFVFHVLFHPRACGACRTNPMSKRNISILEQTGSQSDEGALVCSVRGEEKQKGRWYITYTCIDSAILYVIYSRISMPVGHIFYLYSETIPQAPGARANKDSETSKEDSVYICQAPHQKKPFKPLCRQGGVRSTCSGAEYRKMLWEFLIASV